MDFIPAKEDRSSVKSGDGASSGLDGAALYASNCAACHQPDGSGLAGAFPPLAGSSIVTGEDTDLFIEIILRGYDARPEYAVMVRSEEHTSELQSRGQIVCRLLLDE